jgi:DNA-binding Lrp family transcriptional regulator
MEENKVVNSAAEAKAEKKAQEQASKASRLLDEIKKENKPLTGPQMVEVEKRVGISPNDGWSILEVFRKSGIIIKFKTKDSHRAPALYALPEHRSIIDTKRWTFEVKDEEVNL